MKAIILHDHEVRALLERGRVLLVRPMAKQPEAIVSEIASARVLEDHKRGNVYAAFYDTDGSRIADCDVYSPYGKPGERRWVRECWAYWVCEHPIYEGASHEMAMDAGDPDLEGYPIHMGNESEYVPIHRATNDDYRGPWTSATHMPRWASRATVEVEHVKAARWQGIKPEQVEAAGVNVVRHLPAWVAPGADLDGLIATMAQRAMAEAWGHYHPRHPWGDDGWAWFVMVRRVEEGDDG
jgi:hypothetical protein